MAEWKTDKDTYVTRKGVSPNTVTEISSKTKIWATSSADSSEGVSNPIQVGVIASFDPSESRSIEPIRGIGFGDQIAELIPGMTEPMSISVSRAAQYLANMFQVFGYKGGASGLVRSLKHHRWPFDIIKETVFSEIVSTKVSSDLTLEESMGVNESAFKALKTYMEGCWFSSWSTSYTSDSVLVQEQVDIQVSDIYDGNTQEITEPAIDTGNKELSSRFVSSTETATT
jgi:hypothetical protein